MASQLGEPGLPNSPAQTQDPLLVSELQARQPSRPQPAHLQGAFLMSKPKSPFGTLWQVKGTSSLKPGQFVDSHNTRSSRLSTQTNWKETAEAAKRLFSWELLLFL